METINLNGLRMNAIDTDANGVVNAETIFHFHQLGETVWAESVSYTHLTLPTKRIV